MGNVTIIADGKTRGISEKMCNVIYDYHTAVSVSTLQTISLTQESSINRHYRIPTLHKKEAQSFLQAKQPEFHSLSFNN